MTTTDLAEPISVRTMLFGSDEDAVEVLRAAVTSGHAASLLGDALATVSAATGSAVVEEFTKVVAGLFAIDLTDALMMGWRSHQTLMAAARRTAQAADTEELVDLVTHEISWAQEPYVELFVDGLKVATVHFQLSLNLEVKALVASINGGRLTAVHSGSCTLTAALTAQTLAAKALTLAERSAHVDLPLVLHLGRGLPLCEPPDRVMGSRADSARLWLRD
ncbi:MAG: hypothetical protein L0H96_10550 [Humibacillus sp.]|nr:hypothetical protein [Humibacillus sp.]MDN5777340.1 hypothetical protein [Humibacillus sp.]